LFAANIVVCRKSNFVAIFTPGVDFPDHIKVYNLGPVGTEKGITG
jgi:hypothetical protein